MERKIKSLGEMSKFAAEVLKKLAKNPQPGDTVSKLGTKRKAATVLALSGNLGSGKTAFVKMLAENLGVKKIIQSPTFVIMKVYDISYKKYKRLIHIDAYRIEKNKELQILGWKDLIKNPENIIAIEWPENVKRLIPKQSIKINFKFVDDSTRIVQSVSM